MNYRAAKTSHGLNSTSKIIFLSNMQLHSKTEQLVANNWFHAISPDESPFLHGRAPEAPQASIPQFNSPISRGIIKGIPSAMLSFRIPRNPGIFTLSVVISQPSSSRPSSYF